MNRSRGREKCAFLLFVCVCRLKIAQEGGDVVVLRVVVGVGADVVDGATGGDLATSVAASGVTMRVFSLALVGSGSWCGKQGMKGEGEKDFV